MSLRVSRDPYESVFFYSSQPKAAMFLSPKEQEYFELLKMLPMDSILDGNKGQEECRRIGREVFDYFNNENKNNPDAGRQAMQNIADALFSHCPDGEKRKQRIISVWMVLV